MNISSIHLFIHSCIYYISTNFRIYLRILFLNYQFFIHLFVSNFDLSISYISILLDFYPNVARGILLRMKIDSTIQLDLNMAHWRIVRSHTDLNLTYVHNHHCNTIFVCCLPLETIFLFVFVYWIYTNIYMSVCTSACVRVHFDITVRFFPNTMYITTYIYIY